MPGPSHSSLPHGLDRSPSDALDVTAQALTLVDVLRARAALHGDREAYLFLDEGEIETARLTYAELDRRAQSVAAHLAERCRPGERALLLYPPGLDYIAAFFGCLYAGIVAVPVYPPTPGRQNRTQFRFLSVMHDAQAALALTVASVVEMVEAARAAHPALSGAQWIATDTLPAAPSGGWDPPVLDADALAFLQYTSGSTSSPKGVMVTHANLMHNEAMIRTLCRHDASSSFAGWLPLSHDMGLIGNVLQPLYLGSSCVLMSPAAFLQKPLRWLAAISRYRARTSGGPNFAYDLCVRKTTPEQRAQLDLSCWTTAFNGAEPVRAETLRRFAEAFAPCGFRETAFFPCYGMAETTLIVSGGRTGEPPRSIAADAAALDTHRVRLVPSVTPTSDGAAAGPAEHAEREAGSPRPPRTFVGCGQGAGGERIVIADPSTGTACAPGHVGEIWVSGGNVARGYWNRPDDTEAIFHARITGTDDPSDGGRQFLRTGDLGVLHDGDLFIVGRLKDLIVIRGRNLHPEDIEVTAEQAHPLLRPGGGAAFEIEVDGEAHAALVHETGRLSADEVTAVVRAIRSAVTRAHDVPVHTIALVARGTIPKTTSGKIQRRACRERFLDGTLNEIARDVLGGPLPLHERLRGATEADRRVWLERYLQPVLAAAIPGGRSLPADLPLSSAGLDSLGAHELQARLSTDLGVTIDAPALLDDATPASVIDELLAQLARSAQPSRPVASDDPPSTAHAAAAAESVGAAEHASPPDAGTGDVFAPLSYNQQSLWFLSRLAPRSAAYHICRAVRLAGALDAAALQAAVQRLADRHAALRTTFETIDGVVHQRVHRSLVYTVDVRPVAADTPDEQLIASVQQDAARPFDLASAPPLRLSLFVRGPADHVLLVAVHHILVDFWSLAIILRELEVLYGAALAGAAADLPPVTADYVDYARWQRAMLDSPDGERLRAYWMARIAGAATPLDLPADRPRQGVQGYRGHSIHFHIDPALTAAVEALARTHSTTLATFLLAAFQLLLLRLSGQRTVAVGVPSSGRRDARFDRVVGYCVNPLVCLARHEEGASCLDFVAQVRSSMLEAMAHEDYPFARLVQEAHPERDPSRSPLFQAMFVWQRAPANAQGGMDALALNLAGSTLRIAGLPATVLGLEPGTAQFDVRLMMAAIEGRLAGWLEYDADLFEEATARRFARHFETLLRGIAADPHAATSHVTLLDDGERRQIISAWNDTARDFESSCCIHELVERQVARSPLAIAAIDARGSMTYAELNAEANRLARLMRAQGVERGSLVGVYLDRSALSIVAVLAVLKTGAAYVPIEPAYPASRVQWILHSLAIRCVIIGAVQQALIGQAREALPQLTDVICLDDLDHPDQSDHLDHPDHAVEAEAMARAAEGSLPRLWRRADLASFAAEDLAVRVGADDLAYIIFTSGSTGTPKGVIVQHRPVINVVDWVNRTGAIGPDDRLLFVASLCFDLSVYDIFGILASGGSIRVVSSRELREPARLVEMLSSEPITLWDSAPAALQQLVPFFPAVADACRQQPLRLVLLSGDWIPVTLPDQVRHYFPRARVLALGGATEATVWSNAFPVERVDPEWTSIPYGKPIQNARYHVLDRHLAPCPIGVPGDLYIGGECLSCGYVNEPSLTAQKYCPDPFGPAGARLYRTGDLARYRADGNLEFLGRTDQQVKIRGFRVELGEIESVLSAHPLVRDTVVIARGEPRGVKTIAAYVVPAGSIDSGELQAHVRSRLPEYMVPASIVTIDAIPITSNGKLDRAALARLDAKTSDETAYAAPRTATEQALAAIWAEVLEVPRVGLRENFFALGGHSLLMTQVIARVRTQFGVDVPVAEFFRAPTIADLAVDVLRRRAGEGQGPEALEQLIDTIDAMSPEQVDAFLASHAAAGDYASAFTSTSTSISSPPDDRSQDGGGTAASVGEGGSRIRCGDVRSTAVGDGFVLVSTPDGHGRTLPADSAELLIACREFATPRAHALERAARTTLRDSHTDSHADLHVDRHATRSTGDEIAAVSRLRQFAADGLIQDEAASIRALVTMPSAPLAQSSDAGAGARITTLGYLTCDRPGLIRRGLGSYLENGARYGRTTSILVLDDGRDAAKTAACRDEVAALARESGATVRYAGRAERTEFAATLASHAGLPHDLVTFALCGSDIGVTTAGGLRNALAIAAAGECVLTVDDDTVCRIGAAPEPRDGVSFVSASYSPELYPVADRQDLRERITWLERDLLGLHEPLLGASAPACAGGQDPAAVRVDRTSPRFLQQLTAGRGRVAASFTGYIGDCGWASPSNYLFLPTSSLDRVTRTAEIYQAACTSRDCLQIVNDLTVSNRADHVMMAFAGLDQRELLPPFLPCGRAQDNLFGTVLTLIDPDACVAHLPFGMLHLPEERRVFWAGEVTRAASGLDLATLVRLCLVSVCEAAPTTRARALRRLGRHLQEIGDLPVHAFEAFARDRWRDEAGRVIEHLEDAVRARHGEPAYWADDVRRFIMLLRRSLLRPDCFIPLDLLYGRSTEQAVQLTQSSVRQFGELLSAWPALIDAARDLRARGRGMALEVRGANAEGALR